MPYRIKRLSDNKFSTGGCTPRKVSFTKVGKVWSNKAALHCHLSELKSGFEYYQRHHPAEAIWPYDNCIIEVLEVTSVDSISDHLK